MSGRKRRPALYYIILIGILWLLVRNLEPLRTVNEMYSAPWYLVVFVFFISGVAFFSLAFREGKVIRREILSKRKEESI